MKGLTSDAILYYIDNPVDFVEDIIGAKPDVNQKAILNSLAKYPMTSVRSGHGIGKSAVEAWAVIWFICTRPYPKSHVLLPRSTSCTTSSGQKYRSGSAATPPCSGRSPGRKSEST